MVRLNVPGDILSTNFDGPDGMQCYWHDSRKEEQVFSKITFRRGSAELVVIEGRLNALKYVCFPLLKYIMARTSSFSKITHPSTRQRLLNLRSKTKMLPY